MLQRRQQSKDALPGQEVGLDVQVSDEAVLAKRLGDGKGHVVVGMSVG